MTLIPTKDVKKTFLLMFTLILGILILTEIGEMYLKEITLKERTYEIDWDLVKIAVLMTWMVYMAWSYVEKGNLDKKTTPKKYYRKDLKEVRR